MNSVLIKFFQKQLIWAVSMQTQTFVVKLTKQSLNVHSNLSHQYFSRIK